MDERDVTRRISEDMLFPPTSKISYVRDEVSSLLRILSLPLVSSSLQFQFICPFYCTILVPNAFFLSLFFYFLTLVSLHLGDMLCESVVDGM